MISPDLIAVDGRRYPGIRGRRGVDDLTGNARARDHARTGGAFRTIARDSGAP